MSNDEFEIIRKEALKQVMTEMGFSYKIVEHIFDCSDCQKKVLKFIEDYR